MHWLLHVTGIDTQQSPWYDFWSGVGTQISLCLGAIAVYRKHNCHKRWCPWIGRYPVGQYYVCRGHHPALPRHISLEHIQHAFNQSKEVNNDKAL
jgi:hypothetical protein